MKATRVTEVEEEEEGETTHQFQEHQKLFCPDKRSSEEELATTRVTEVEEEEETETTRQLQELKKLFCPDKRSSEEELAQMFKDLTTRIAQEKSG